MVAFFSYHLHMKMIFWRFLLAIFMISATDSLFAKGGKHAQQEQSEDSDDESEGSEEAESTDEVVEESEDSNDEENSQEEEESSHSKKKSSKKEHEARQKLIEKAKEEKRESQQHVRTLVDELLGRMHIGGGASNRKAHTAGYIGDRIDKLYKEIDSLQKSLQQFSKETSAEDSRAKAFQRDIHLALEKFLGHDFKDDGKAAPPAKKPQTSKARRTRRGRLKCRGNKHTIFTVKNIKIPAGYRNSYLPYKNRKKPTVPKPKKNNVQVSTRNTIQNSTQTTTKHTNKVKYFNSKCATCGR